MLLNLAHRVTTLEKSSTDHQAVPTLEELKVRRYGVMPVQAITVQIWRYSTGSSYFHRRSSNNISFTRAQSEFTPPVYLSNCVQSVDGKKLSKYFCNHSVVFECKEDNLKYKKQLWELVMRRVKNSFPAYLGTMVRATVLAACHSSHVTSSVTAVLGPK